MGTAIDLFTSIASALSSPLMKEIKANSDPEKVGIARGGTSWASSEAVRRSMRGNRNKDTKPEMAVRRLVHGAGLRYRVASRPEMKLRNTADMVFSGPKVAVFIDGCFWHSCPLHGVRPKSNIEYWDVKLETNRVRDARVTALLKKRGWRVLRFWEHEDPEKVAVKVIKVVRSRSATLR